MELSIKAAVDCLAMVENASTLHPFLKPFCKLTLRAVSAWYRATFPSLSCRRSFVLSQPVLSRVDRSASCSSSPSAGADRRLVSLCSWKHSQANNKDVSCCLCHRWLNHLVSSH